jgi:proteasome alpha subunit
MSMPFYVAPEQFMKDKADFARKNIARGRPLVATVCASGILICAENPSKSLHKVSEIYDRIAFAGVGRYNEFDSLRRAGVQHADVKGYQYSREDVDARSLANLYAQYMGNVFTHELKPLEVEILVAEVGSGPAGDQLFHILYDGSVVDEDSYSVLGGEAEAILERLKQGFDPGWDLEEAVRRSARALFGPDREPVAGDLEVAILARSNGRRAFERLDDERVAQALSGGQVPSGDAAAATGAAATGAADPQGDGPDDGAPGAEAPEAAAPDGEAD